MRVTSSVIAISMSFVLIFSTNLKSFITIDYLFNQAEITQLFCVNKDQPTLQCNGKCHLAKEIAAVEIDDKEEPMIPIQNNSNLQQILFSEYPQELFTPGNYLNEINNVQISAIGNELQGYFLITTPPPQLMA